MLKTAASDITVLEKSFLFGALDEADRRELAGRAYSRTYAAGMPIFHLGAPGDSMMAVLSGTVRISLPTPKGKELVLSDLSPGELFGEVALLDGAERSAAATALTDCELLVLHRRDVLPFLEQNPAACLKLLSLLCARLRGSDERMADIAFSDLGARLAKTLLQKTAASGHSSPAKLALSQSELGNMIGGTRENVNRLLRDWRRLGIVETRKGWIVIVRPDHLAQLANRG